ncbi:MAG TPA: NAD-binding protein [Oscillospiraceae bacterium]|nr:NAD-binding protein [Oscillospiraceae bacterium]
MRVIIAGGGETGKALAVVLSAVQEVVVIESNRSRADWLAQHLDGQVIWGEAQSLQTLLAAGTGGADLFVAATGVDEINLLACLTAKRLGCIKVAACLKNPDYWEGQHLLNTELKSLDVLLHPVLLAAHAVVKQLINPSFVVNLSFANGRVALLALELTQNSHFVGQQLQQLELPGQAVICAVTRQGETSARAKNFTLSAGDQIYVIGDALRKSHWLPSSEQISPPQRVLIGDGSWLGQQIASLMGSSLQHMENVLLEADLVRCEELADGLPRSRIYQGAITEHTFLAAIVNAKTDWFVAASDNDLVNILSALLAKNLGVRGMIVVARNQSAQVALKTAGINNIISPKTLVAEKVLSLLQRDNWHNFAIIGDGPVQAIEVVVQEGMPLVHKRFGEDRLADGLIWGAMVRQGQLISPHTAERVQANDHLILLMPQGLSTTSSALLTVENVIVKKKTSPRLSQS